MATSSTSRSFTFIGLMILAVVGVAAGIYMQAYRPWRETYFRQSRMRQLAVFAEQARGSVGSRFWALQNAVDEYSDDHKTAAGVDKDPWVTKALGAAKLKPVPCAQLDQGDTVAGAAKGNQQVAIVANAKAGLVQTDPVALGRATAETSANVHCDALAVFSYRPDSAASASGARLCAQATLSTLFEPLLKDGSFDGVDLFIARDGEVLFERGPGSLRLGDLYGVQGTGGSEAKRDEAKKAGKKQVGGTGEEAKKEEPKGDGAAKSAVSDFPDWKELAATTIFRPELSLGGERYVLLSQPVRVQGQMNRKWVVGMLVPKARFESDVASLSFGAVSGLPLVLLLLLLAAPLLKVRAMGPRDRFTWLDARLLFVSLLGFAGVTVAVGLGSYSYLQLERQLDSDLENLSKQIRSRFQDEVKQAALALDTFIERQAAASPKALQSSRPPAGAAGPQLRRVVELFGSCKAADGSDCCSDVDARTASPAARTLRSQRCPTRSDGTADPAAAGVVSAMWRQYPYIDAVGWSDGGGQLHERWTTKESAPRSSGSRESQWMTDLRERRVWGVKARLEQRPSAGVEDVALHAPLTGTEALPLVLHVMIYPNTGLLVPVLATSRQQGDQLVAAHMNPELMSVNQPLLPEGFGFAMIQNDGRVVFHSNYTRGLYENFYDECDAAADVRAMIEASSTRFFDGYYRGRKQRLYVHAVEGSPWSLVVFRDKELPRTAELDALMSWSVMFFAYLGLFALAQTLIRCFAPPEEGEWYWPDGDGRDRYEDCAFVLALNTTAIAAAIARRPEPSGLVLVAAMALVLASGAFVYLRLAPPLEGIFAAGRRVRRRMAILALCVAALALWPLYADRVLAGILLTAGAATVATLGSAASLPIGRSRLSWLLLALVASACWLVSIADARFLMSFPLFLVAVFAWVTAVRIGAPGRAWPTPYVAAAVLFVAVAGILPSAMFYQDAFDVSMGVFVRHGSAKLAEALEKRDGRIRCSNKDKADGRLIPPRLSETRDVYLSPLIGGPDVFREEGQQCGRTEPDARHEMWGRLEAWLRSNGLGMDPRLDPVGGTALAAGDLDEHSRQVEPVCGGWFTWLSRFVTDAHFSAPILAELPVYHPESVATRGFVQTQTDDTTWRWILRDGCSEFSWVRSDGSHGAPIRGWKEFPGRSRMMSAPEWVFLLMVIAGALLVIWATLRWLARRLLGMGATIASNQEETGVATARGALLLGDFEAIATTIANARVIDLADDQPLAAAATPSQRILALHLERRIEDLDQIKNGLEIVGKLMARPEPVFLASKVDPLAYFRRRIQSTWDTGADEHLRPEVVASWARVLERAMRLPLAAGPRALEILASGLPADPEAWWLWRFLTPPANDAWSPERIDDLWQECSWTSRLRGIAWEVWACNPAPAGRTEVVALVREAAAAHYRAQWSLLTDPEQLILVQLAQEGFVNPTEKSWRILARLAQRGFVHFTPAARLASESFRQFVLSEETDQQVRDWEKADGASWWDSARDGIVYVLMAGGVFLYLTHPDDLNGMAGILGAISGATGKVAGWFDLWGVSRGDKAAAKTAAKPETP